MKFTKKPVTIDAVQWNKDGDHPNVVELPKKVRDTIDERTTALGVDALRWIGTLEGGHIVCKGDWIITGVQGEQYPCKPDIFALTYDAAPIPPTEVEPATEYAEYILDHYDRKSRKDRKLLGKHLAEWADRRYRDAAPIPSIKITNEMAYAFHRAITDSDLGSDDVAEIKKGLAAALANYAVPIPPTVTTQKFLDAEQFLAAFPVSENEIYQLGHKFLRYQTHNCNEINLVEFVRAVFEAAPIPPTDEIVEIKRQRDSAVGSLKWIHNAAKTGASIDVICGYTKGALQEVRLAAPIPPEPSPRIKDFSELRDELDAAPISPTIELATEYAEYILDHYDRKSKQDRQLLGKHLAEWADRRYRNAAPIPPDEPRLKRASLMAFGVISEIRKLVGNGKVQFVADLGGSIWTWPDAADSAITELRSVCFDAAPIQPTPSQQEVLK